MDDIIKEFFILLSQKPVHILILVILASIAVTLTIILYNKYVKSGSDFNDIKSTLDDVKSRLKLLEVNLSSSSDINSERHALVINVLNEIKRTLHRIDNMIERITEGNKYGGL